MAAVRSCVCLLVVLVHLQGAVSKPFFDWLFCDMLCDEDDISASTTTTSTTDWDDLFSFDCSDCPGAPTTPRPAQSISLNLPSIPNGMRMNVTDNNGILQFVLNAVELTGAGGPAVAAPAAGAAAPAGNATAGAAPANATAG